MSENWNYGDIFDAVSEIVPGDRPALIHGDRLLSWAEFSARSNNLARNLLANGANPGDKVAFYMRNCPEYMEGVAAACKARLVHVNVNYRYVESELIYLLDDADATVCFYNAEFAESVALIRDQLPRVKQWIEVDDGIGVGLDDANRYENYAESGTGARLSEVQREPTDKFFIYTGGTTGMPKGVIWSHQALWCALGGGGNPRIGIAPCENLQEHCARVKANPVPSVALPLPPLMHGTGLFGGLNALVAGGTCVTLAGKHFDAELALAAIDKHKVTAVSIVGDAFARPILDVLDQNPGKYDVSSLAVITSSGVMWTQKIKQGLLRYNENLMLVDAFSSSEAIGLGFSLTTKDAVVDVAKFTLSPNCKVFSEDGQEVLSGTGLVAVSGNLAEGYYKDQAKTDETFKVYNGVRYSIPGDFVRIEEDGCLTLLGRGSHCINTAGEKVFPEEVEEALKIHPNVVDSLVVGVNDEKWGQAITAVVELQVEATLDEAEMRDFLRQNLAGYKVPKRIFARQSLERASNGKADYDLIREFVHSKLSG